MRLVSRAQRPRLNRRAFLRGAAGVSVALPFLESLPERSAWAASDAPVFSLFIGAVGGVVGEKFFPSAPGALTVQGLEAAGKATSALARHAENLLFVSGVNFPTGGSDSHQEGLCAALTGRKPHDVPTACTTCVSATGRSADWEVAAQAQPATQPLVVYWGNRSYTRESLSFSAADTAALGVTSPYQLYQQLVGLTGSDGAPTPDGDLASQRLLASRQSVHDLVREELTALMKHPRLGLLDRQRLQQHFDAIRDVEVTFGGMANEAAEHCRLEGLNVDRLEALQSFVYDPKRTEEMVGLHLGLIALAFACNFKRTASLQWGDAYDGSIYAVPSNARGWTMNHISHRMQSDAMVGDDTLAALAHAEIDQLRMTTLAAGLDQLAARGLTDRSVVLWTNQFADGPAHSLNNVPHIIWGSGGGYLKQGAYIHAGGVQNDRLLTTVINAAIGSSGEPLESFGQASGGPLDELIA